MLTDSQILSLYFIDNIDKGITIENILKHLAIPFSSKSSITISKELKSKGWTKSETRYRDKNNRFYLWFAPVTSCDIQKHQIQKLKDEKNLAENHIEYLQSIIHKQEQEIEDLKNGLKVEEERLKTEIEDLKNQIKASSLPFHDVQVSPKVSMGIQETQQPIEQIRAISKDDDFDLEEMKKVIFEDSEPVCVATVISDTNLDIQTLRDLREKAATEKNASEYMRLDAIIMSKL